MIEVVITDGDWVVITSLAMYPVVGDEITLAVYEPKKVIDEEGCFTDPTQNFSGDGYASEGRWVVTGRHIEVAYGYATVYHLTVRVA